tara:strand:- start:3769 stop:5157 length:1389 start_codon:yes stop_codon:yes gene_type:complete
MAFLGSLGKALGLDSEFGKGLVRGTAEGFAEGFQDDIDRTKTNIDNLVQTSFKSGISQKREFDASFKDNKKIVDEIISNLGGIDGNNAEDVLLAADGLVNQFGLTNALKYSKSAAAASSYGESPLNVVKIAERFNHSTPITSSLITKRTVDPVVMPDMKELGKDAAVGIMKFDIFGGDPAFAGNEVAKRSEALLKAAGVDINDSGALDDLPPSAKVKLDPLLLGMSTDPATEVRRLQMFNAKLDPKDPDYVKKQARIKNMMDFQFLQAKKTAELQRSGKITPFTFRDYMALDKGVTDLLVKTYDFNFKQNNIGEYLSTGDSDKQRKLINETVRYYSDIIALAFSGGVDVNQMPKLFQAISTNKKLTVIDGKLEVLTQDKLSESQLTDIKKKSSPIVGVEEKNLNLKQQTIPNLVDLYKDAKSKDKTRLMSTYSGKIRSRLESKNPTFTSTEIDEEMKKLGVI